MDKDRIVGAAQKIKGTIEKTVGNIVGNEKLETDGKIDEVTGDVRKKLGDAKDIVREAVNNGSK